MLLKRESTSRLPIKNPESCSTISLAKENEYFTTNLPLVEFLHILTAFYHLLISLVLFTHSLKDACEFAQVGLNYTMN